MTEHTHEYRVSYTFSMSGSDREQTAHKAKIHPLIEAFERGVAELGLPVAVSDVTVKLGRGKKAVPSAAELSGGTVKPIERA